MVWFRGLAYPPGLLQETHPAPRLPGPSRARRNAPMGQAAPAKRALRASRPLRGAHWHTACSCKGRSALCSQGRAS
ncbi:hypothetical protein D187_001489 [Cystobacter fuscus DSM 2262]|uniref:Uncharacterized protein n=1 Tax=Cystobacter fuscus (strain ATCC 25194 / DSM 2262 / NBRC 100088 / M29) TaxID=1242864 RepID=S9QVY6_CYSF2|nr:hypothetical protein D187_001489 [Cystobacter fuscus DSM 2262]